MYNNNKKLLSSETINYKNSYSLYDIFEKITDNKPVIEKFVDPLNLIVYSGYLKPISSDYWNFIVDATDDADFHIQLRKNDDTSWVKVAASKNGKFSTLTGVQLDVSKYYKFIIRNLRRNTNKGSRFRVFWNSGPVNNPCMQDKSSFINKSGGIESNTCGFQEIPKSSYYIDANPEREKNIAGLRLEKENYRTQQCEILTNQLSIDNNTSQFYQYFNSLIRNNTLTNKFFDRRSHDANYNTAEARQGDICNNNTFYFGFPVTANP